MISSLLSALFLFLAFSLQAQDTVNILFIGNSLTYYNNLPALVEKEAVKNGKAVSCDMVAKPNYALIDHWNDGEIQQKIKSGRYDFVIVQQGPSSQPEGRNMLIEDGKRIAKLCTENNAQLCFLMVWPSLNYYSTFDGVVESHELAAETCNSLLIPVGAKWKEHIDSSRDYSYYGPDGFHPSPKGSAKAAQIIIETLF